MPWILIPTLLLLLFTGSGQALAEYGNVNRDSQVDPKVVKIDEKTYLGVKLDESYALQDENGSDFTLGDMFGKPLVLALAYYTCDGACPTLNRNLMDTLSDVDRWKLGEDFNVLTVSFDKHDTPEKLATFMKKAGFKDTLPEGWRMATLTNPEDIMRLTGSMGYKFFWSPRDAIFLHPSVYIMISPKGRVTRYLYGANIEGSDMEISITKAYGEELTASNVINFVLGACYSYNYKDGKYKVNIPLFVALGGLIFGGSLLTFGMLRTKKRRMKQDSENITV
ncbi:MAG: SCO family protein [Mariprofundaceae bacterium]